MITQMISAKKPNERLNAKKTLVRPNVSDQLPTLPIRPMFQGRLASQLEPAIKARLSFFCESDQNLESSTQGDEIELGFANRMH